MSYNGWSNYETWNVSLWLNNNEEGLYWDVKNEIENLEKNWRLDTKEERIEGLSNWLEGYVWTIAENLNNKFGDLDIKELNKVDWLEIANGFEEDFEDDEFEDEEEDE